MQAPVEHAHELILVGGLLGLLSIFAGLVSARVNAPLLLVFLVVGMLAGEDGPGGIAFSDFGASYLIGSIALAAILFEGGFKTERSMLRQAFWPALAMGTAGVAVTAGVVASAGVVLFGAPWGEAMVIGAALAPTDAAAVGLLLRRAQVALPHRLTALLEVESGLNDPMSVFLTVVFVEALVHPGTMTSAHAALLFATEMGGGAVVGIAGGAALLALLRRLPAEASMFPILTLAGVLALFGAAQMAGASGFLAVYLMGVIAGNSDYATRARMEELYEAFAWLAQITLFLLLGLLITPHAMLPDAVAIAAVAAVLILVARPLATFACLLPFGFGMRGTAFAAWVGLRGAVPIYLTIIPVLQGAPNGQRLFGVAFGTVVASLVVQGWTIRQAATLLGFGRTKG
jgi:cell volume regulation protein A